MGLVPERCRQVVATFGSSESLTVLLASGVTREHVAATLDVDLSHPVEPFGWDRDRSAWGVHDIPGGVLAVERSGYGDPSRAALRSLSRHGHASAVVRSNIQAHVRFGCARDGELVIDDDEYRYLTNDVAGVPEELRPLMELVDDEEQDEDLFLVGLAMTERFTSLAVVPDHVATLMRSQFYVAPPHPYWTKAADS